MKGYEMELKDMNVEQLKALAYDQLVLLQQTQNNINIIQQEIANRQKISEGEKDDTRSNAN